MMTPSKFLKLYEALEAAVYQAAEDDPEELEDLAAAMFPDQTDPRVLALMMYLKDLPGGERAALVQEVAEEAGTDDLETWNVPENAMNLLDALATVLDARRHKASVAVSSEARLGDLLKARANDAERKLGGILKPRAPRTGGVRAIAEPVERLLDQRYDIDPADVADNIDALGVMAARIFREQGSTDFFDWQENALKVFGAGITTQIRAIYERAAATFDAAWKQA